MHIQRVLNSLSEISGVMSRAPFAMAELSSSLVPMVVALTILLVLMPKVLVLYRHWSDQSYVKGESVYDAEVEPDKVDVEVIRESEFPEDWWTSDKLFKLEERAVFCKVLLFYLNTVSTSSQDG